MKVVSQNQQLRRDIDAGRHEKSTLLTASASIERDSRVLVTESASLEKAIQAKQLKREEVENEIEAVKEESEMKQVHPCFVLLHGTRVPQDDHQLLLLN